MTRFTSQMPSGKTHDIITFLLTPPAFAVGYAATHSAAMGAAAAAAFVFGGLMFGPDLDTVSKQYSRWSIFRFLWLPYRSFFKHRSRWSHGLVFGTLIRVVYFMGALTAAAICAAYLGSLVLDYEMPAIADFARSWQAIGDATRANLGMQFAPAVFLGMWMGAASHTMTDLAGSYIKTGRVTEFL